jgi:hypothetical protein
MKAGLDGYFPDRRESIPGGCGKNILFFTLRKIPVQPGLLQSFSVVHELFRLAGT